MLKPRHFVAVLVLAACAAMLPPMPSLKDVRPPPIRGVRLSWTNSGETVQLMVASNPAPDAYWTRLLETTNDHWFSPITSRAHQRYYKLLAARLTKIRINSPGYPFVSYLWLYASPSGTNGANGTWQLPYRYDEITNSFPGVDVALISGSYTNWTPARVVINHTEPPEIGTDGYPAAYTVDVY